MKAFYALLLGATLLMPTVIRAQETPAAPAAEESSPAETIPAESSGAAETPSAAESTTDLTPAQDVPIPNQDSSLDLMPARDTAPEPSVLEPALIPEAPEPVPIPVPESSDNQASKAEKNAKAKEKKNKTAIATDEMELRIRYRQAKTQALKDPAVQAEWATAETARTDYEKREALKRFYTFLYGRMEKLDKSLKKEIETHRTTALRRLDQNRIEPTQAPDPHLRAAQVEQE